MRLVLTLRTRDQEDLAGANVAFHLAAGVDFVIANDHRSADGTREVLRRFERAGRLRLLCRDDEGFVPGEWVNEMARMASLEHGADWVIHADADEFWWPRGGDLKSVLTAVPDRFGILLCPWRHFVPRPDDDRYFAERMVVRISSHSAWTRPEDPFHPNVNVVHRARPDISVRPGNHDVDGPLSALRGWHPIEVLHFPLRSREQARARTVAWSTLRGSLGGIAPHVEAAGRALDQEGGFDAYFERYVVDEPALRVGMEAGTLVRDTRLRDALRALGGDRARPLPQRPEFPATPRESLVVFAQHDVRAAASLADDVMALQSPEARVECRVEELERRIARLARPRSRGVARRARSLLHGFRGL
jgi:hypothetical protein